MDSWICRFKSLKGIIIVYLCCNFSSQLDMDRMDYLKRDSFYSGVAEGM
jgi:HD superfamily phosphohydrolase